MGGTEFSIAVKTPLNFAILPMTKSLQYDVFSCVSEPLNIVEYSLFGYVSAEFEGLSLEGYKSDLADIEVGEAMYGCSMLGYDYSVHNDETEGYTVRVQSHLGRFYYPLVPKVQSIRSNQLRVSALHSQDSVLEVHCS